MRIIHYLIVFISRCYIFRTVFLAALLNGIFLLQMKNNYTHAQIKYKRMDTEIYDTKYRDRVVIK